MTIKRMTISSWKPKLGMVKPPLGSNAQLTDYLRVTTKSTALVPFHVSRVTCHQRRILMSLIARFEDLQAWKEARKLMLGMYCFTATGPISRDFGLRDQAPGGGFCDEQCCGRIRLRI